MLVPGLKMYDVRSVFSLLNSTPVVKLCLTAAVMNEPVRLVALAAVFVSETRVLARRQTVPYSSVLPFESSGCVQT